MSTIDVAVPSYLARQVLPALASCGPIRAWLMAPPRVSEWIAEGRLDAAVTVGFEAAAPAGWKRASVGTVRSALFASPRAADSLGEAPTLDAVLARRFVSPVHAAWNGETSHGDDRCPIAADARLRGNQVESIGDACALAAAGDELVYGPEVAAAPFLADGRLVELDLLGWARVDDVHLAVADAGLVEIVREAMAHAPVAYARTLERVPIARRA